MAIGSESSSSPDSQGASSVTEKPASPPIHSVPTEEPPGAWWEVEEGSHESLKRSKSEPDTSRMARRRPSARKLSFPALPAQPSSLSPPLRPPAMINGEPLAWWGLSDDTVLEPAEIIEFDAERPTRDMMTSRSVPSTPQFDLPPRRPRTASTFPPYQERRTEDAPSRGCQFEIGDGHTLSPSSSASPGTISPRQPKKPCLIPDQLPMEGRDSSPRRRSSSQQVRFSSGRRPQADQGASRSVSVDAVTLRVFSRETATRHPVGPSTSQAAMAARMASLDRAERSRASMYETASDRGGVSSRGCDGRSGSFMYETASDRGETTVSDPRAWRYFSQYDTAEKAAAAVRRRPQLPADSAPDIALYRESSRRRSRRLALPAAASERSSSLGTIVTRGAQQRQDAGPAPPLLMAGAASPLDTPAGRAPARRRDIASRPQLPSAEGGARPQPLRPRSHSVDGDLPLKRWREVSDELEVPRMRARVVSLDDVASLSGPRDQRQEEPYRDGAIYLDIPILIAAPPERPEERAEIPHGTIRQHTKGCFRR